MRDYRLQLPDGHTENIDSIEYRFEFSRSEYKMGKVVKMRITVTNHLDHEVWISRKNTSARFVRNDGETLSFEIVDKKEWVNEFTQDIVVHCFEPEESIVYERAVALPTAFFDPEQSYALAFDFNTYSEAILVTPYAAHNISIPVQLVK